MNTKEKFFAAIGILVILLGACLRIGHFVEAGTGMAMIVMGNVLLLRAFSHYNYRLTSRVSELEQEVQHLRSAH